MTITVTSLTHPTMIAKIRQAMYLAHKGKRPQLSKIALVCGLTLVLTGCQAPGAMTVLFSFVESLFA